FMFGSERANLAEYAAVLRDVDGDECFYCQRGTKGIADVDHFIPWSRYPIDFGHNFVLAHKSCNASKGDLLAAVPHLHRWWERGEIKCGLLAIQFDAKLLVQDVAISKEVARWAYESAAGIGSKAWQNSDTLRLLEGDRRPWQSFSEAKD